MPPLNNTWTPLIWRFTASLQYLRVLYKEPLIHSLFTHTHQWEAATMQAAASPIGNILSPNALPKEKTQGRI